MLATTDKRQHVVKVPIIRIHHRAAHMTSPAAPLEHDRPMHPLNECAALDSLALPSVGMNYVRVFLSILPVCLGFDPWPKPPLPSCVDAALGSDSIGVVSLP